MELQDVLADSQLLIVEVKPSDYLCHFLIVGSPTPNSLPILKEGINFNIEDLITFFWQLLSHCHLKTIIKPPWFSVIVASALDVVNSKPGRAPENEANPKHKVLP